MIRKLVETIDRQVDGGLTTYGEAFSVKVLGQADGYDRVPPPMEQRSTLALFERSPEHEGVRQGYLTSLYHGRKTTRASERKREIAAALSGAAER
ncbi:hypothetical protein ACMGDM_19375 [Sphingomonas sp. DT-51]|uniref:hypothetical protein n=1 Tax=Sphingomonas sp. DT-51 TaxID=3396165 RepID=UPI003F19F538